MGDFPIIGENLGQEIPFLGLFWEVVVSQCPINGFLLGNTVLSLVSQFWENTVNIYP